MAGGKQTPRQKMINMMYLVLTALLALNVSKEILEAFAIIEQGMQRTNENFSAKNAGIYSKFDNAYAEQPEKVKPYMDAAYNVKDHADDLYAEIFQIRDTLISITGGMDTTTGFPKGMDKREKPMNYMMVDPKNKDEAGNPIATQLKMSINNYRTFLLTVIDSNKNTALADRLRVTLNTDDPEKKGPTNVTWENEHFMNLPLAPIITFLTKMMGDVRNAESDVVSWLASQIGATDVKVNKLDAVAITNSNYVITGDSFKADIFVAAFDTTQSPKVYVYESFDSEGNGIGDPVPVEVADGKGIFRKRTGATGQFTLGGYVEVVTPSGVQNFDFKTEYTVAKPSAVISPTALNVLYRGLENPISISVPGVKPENIQASCSGCTLTGSNGNYVATVSGGNRATISVRDRASGQNLGSQEFRLFRVPPPVAKINNKTQGRIPKASLANAQGIAAIMEDFLFDVTYRVTKFTVRVPDGEYTRTLDVRGNRFNSEVKALIQNAKAGSDVSFTGIEAQGPDGKKDCNAIVFTLN